MAVSLLGLALGVILQIRITALRRTEADVYRRKVAQLGKATSADVEKWPTWREIDRTVWSEYITLLMNTNVPPLSGALSTEESLQELRVQLADLAKRVEEHKNEIVEVYKIDPVLEATLKVSIDNLTRRIEVLENRQLERWDVAVVLMQVLAAIGVLVGIVLGVAKYVAGK
jgi:hypothetical protein